MRVLIFIVGQSNERGTGPAGTGSCTEFGPAHRDPIAPNGNTYSMWPRLVDRLAASGHRAIVRNCAEGSTSITKSWVGMIRSWAANQTIAAGEWCLPTTPNGHKYKSTLARDALNSVSTEPTWPTTNGATVVDNGVTWTCFSTDANDVSGHIYQPGESGFDPSGFFAAIQSRNVGVFDKKIAICAIGQSDWACGTTAAQFGAGWSVACDHLKTLGIEPWLGMTSANAAYLTPFLTQYIPQIDAVVAGGHAKAGAVLPRIFGEQATHDYVHMTAAELDRASDAWSALLIAGI